MKCPNCGAQMGLEDVSCPYCNTPNSYAVQHQSDMERYRSEYERTQEQVLQNTSFMQRNGSWLVILVVLLIALMVGIGLLANSWDIGYSIRESNVNRDIATYNQVMDAYLEQGDYGKFAGYYQSNDLYLSEDDSYQGIRMASDAYVDLIENVSSIVNPDEYSMSPERVSSTCGYIAGDLIKIYNTEEQFSYVLDEYLPESHRAYLEDIRNRARAIAIAYLGLTDEDIESIPTLSERKLALIIEEGVTK